MFEMRYADRVNNMIGLYGEVEALEEGKAKCEMLKVLNSWLIGDERFVLELSLR